MTYNFDPDRWYEMEYAALAARAQSGALSGPAFEAALADLDRRHAEMWNRLERAYQIPAARQGNPESAQENIRRSSTSTRAAKG